MLAECHPDFGPFGGKVWLSCAHQGPLPRVAAEAAREAIEWKICPFELTQERFNGVPARLRQALGQLLGAPSDEIVLGNSASYGLHLLANGIPWKAGDEILLVRGDFPSDLLPWLALEERGVHIRFIEPARHLPEPEELKAALTPRTRVFCSTWVHSFSGVACDLEALGSLCRSNGTMWVVNTSQAIGARPFSIAAPVDAILGVGHKWLCGPYATGYIWMRPELLRSLRFNQSYWLSQITAEDLGKEKADLPRPQGPPTARTFDVFATANFFNFKAWTASIEYLLKHGIDNIARYDQGLVQHLLDNLDNKRYTLLSPREPERRSTLVFLSHKEQERNQTVYARLCEAGIGVAYRKGQLRLAPHLYNTRAELDRTLNVLNSV